MVEIEIFQNWAKFKKVNWLKWRYKFGKVMYGFNLIKKKKRAKMSKFEELSLAKYFDLGIF